MTVILPEGVKFETATEESNENIICYLHARCAIPTRDFICPTAGLVVSMESIQKQATDPAPPYPPQSWTDTIRRLQQAFALQLLRKMENGEMNFRVDVIDIIKKDKIIKREMNDLDGKMEQLSLFE